VERYFLYAGIALCLFSLWAIARHDWVRLTRPSRRVLAQVTGHRTGRSDGAVNYAAIYRFSADGRDHDVTDAVYSSRPRPPLGEIVELGYPAGHPDLARPPRLLMWLAVYGLLIALLAVLGLKLMGWLD
jgi:hypothetical protein